MSERGVFAIDRGLLDHPTFAPGPFTEREAFIWLIQEAAWKPHRRRVAGRSVSIGRGQVVASFRFMAQKWQWSLGKVQRYLAKLVNDGMLTTTSDTGVLVISLCNYCKYQKVALPDDTEADTPSDTGSDTAPDTQYSAEIHVPSDLFDTPDDTRPIQDRYKVEDRESRESNSVPDGTGAPSAAPPKNEFEDESPNPATVLFGPARVWLAKASGRTDTDVRSVLGKWRKFCGKDDALLLEILRSAKENVIGDPTGWIERAIKLRTKMRPAEERWDGTPVAIWRINVESYRKNKFWPNTLGPRPDDFGYRGPPELLTEFGFERAA